MPADAGGANDAVHHPEDPLHVLNGEHLPVVNRLHPPRDHPTDQAADRPRQLIQPVETLHAPLCGVRVGEEVLDKLATAKIAQKIVRVILRLQVPPLSFAVLQAELAHIRTSRRLIIDD